MPGAEDSEGDWSQLANASSDIVAMANVVVVFMRDEQAIDYT